MTGARPMESDLIRVALQADEPSIRDLFERSGMVEIVESAPGGARVAPPVRQRRPARRAPRRSGRPARAGHRRADRRPPQPLVRGGDAPRRRRRALPAAVVPVARAWRPPRPAPRAPAAPRRCRRTASPSASRAGRDAHVFTVFSTKGGSGKTVISTNLAVCFAPPGPADAPRRPRPALRRRRARPRPLAALDGARPRPVARRPRRREARAGSSPGIRAASTSCRRPTRPDEEELVAIDRLEPLLEVAAPELRRGRHRHVVELLAGDAARDRPHRHPGPRRRVGRPDDQEPEDRARDARPARDEPGRHADPHEPLRRQGRPRGSRRRADAAGARSPTPCRPTRRSRCR